MTWGTPFGLWLVELVAKLKEFLWLENIAKEIGIVANRSDQWRYRIGDYRVICEIIDEELVVLAVSCGHRKVTY